MTAKSGIHDSLIRIYTV